MFKPKQFDSFKKVPENQKSNFKEEDGSFVYSEAEELHKRIKDSADAHNEYGRTFKEKFLGKNKFTVNDMFQNELPEILRDEKKFEEREKARKEAWEEFLKTSEVILTNIYKSGSDSELRFNDLRNIHILSKEGEWPYSFKDLIEKKLMKPEQLVELFEIELPHSSSNSLEFTGKMKDGWKERLEEILDKKISIK